MPAKEISMRRIRYAVAASLDGYIAGTKGKADWIKRLTSRLANRPSVAQGRTESANVDSTDLVLVGRESAVGREKLTMACPLNLAVL